jgi:flagellar protein FliS
MKPSATKTWLQHRIAASSANELQLMLYDGALRFARQARAALVDRKLDVAQDNFERVDAILAELEAGLRPEIAPDLCGNYASLYQFCTRRLNEANFKHQLEPLDDAIHMFEHLRDTWRMVLERIQSERSETDTPLESALAG